MQWLNLLQSVVVTLEKSFLAIGSLFLPMERNLHANRGNFCELLLGKRKSNRRCYMDYLIWMGAGFDLIMHI